MARSTRRALDELPDSVLQDIGVMRDDIPFIARRFAFGDRIMVARPRSPRPLRHVALGLAMAAVVAVLQLV